MDGKMLKIEASTDNYELDINPKHVCRLCLEAVHLQNVFSNSIVDGYITSLPDIVQFTLDMTVSRANFRPLLERANQFWDFLPDLPDFHR